MIHPFDNLIGFFCFGHCAKVELDPVIGTSTSTKRRPYLSDTLNTIIIVALTYTPPAEFRVMCYEHKYVELILVLFQS